MDIIELILDEDSEGLTGIEAVSIVEMPAIESDFVTHKQLFKIKYNGYNRINIR
jgi:hypothetical protein